MSIFGTGSGFPTSKRLIDIVLSAIGLVLLGPVMLLAAVVVRLSSQGPVFYIAKRAGIHGRAFGLLKFRTMHIGAHRLGACTAPNDARVFAAGRVLRLFKIDELPQLINVLRGEMSIVGPRPEDWQIVQECYTPAQKQVLDVAPGLTGIPQVRFFPEFPEGNSAGTDPQEYYRRVTLPMRLELDLAYVRTRSFRLDFYLIAVTAWLVLIKSWFVLLGSRMSTGHSGQERKGCNG
jgi:lipopolysaccharide/colanic/teichoic acid biosynthesis glycosyltransferase